jgi:hypothetical protein
MLDPEVVHTDDTVSTPNIDVGSAGNTPGAEDNGFDRPYRTLVASMELFRRLDGPPFERARTVDLRSGDNVENRAGSPSPWPRCRSVGG